MGIEPTLPGYEPDVLAVILPWSSGHRSRTCYRKGYEPCMVIPFHPSASADDRSRTCNFLLVRQVLSQLSYISI